jgi:hypothetical protein
MERYDEARDEARIRVEKYPANSFAEDVDRHLLNHPPNPTDTVITEIPAQCSDGTTARESGFVISAVDHGPVLFAVVIAQAQRMAAPLNVNLLPLPVFVHLYPIHFGTSWH